MTSEWTSPAVIVAAISAAAAIAAAVLGCLVYRHQRRGEDITPQVHCEVKSVDEQPGWYLLWICLENFAAVEWDVEELRLRRPRDAAVALDSDLRIEAGVFTGLAKQPYYFDPHRTARAVSLAFTLRTSTTPGRVVHGRMNLHFFVYSPRATSLRTLSMRLSLRSRERIQRRRAITIKRTLPASTSEVRDEINSTASPPKSPFQA